MKGRGWGSQGGKKSLQNSTVRSSVVLQGGELGKCFGSCGGSGKWFNRTDPGCALPEHQGRGLPGGQLPTRSMQAGLHRAMEVLTEEEEKSFFIQMRGRIITSLPTRVLVYKYLFSDVNSTMSFSFLFKCAEALGSLM